MSAALEDVVLLIDKSDSAFLGTTEPSGAPYVSAAGFVPRREGGRLELWLLISGLARHTQNMLKNQNVSVLLTDPASPLPVFERARATLQGRAEYPVPEAPRAVQEAYLARYPKAKAFLSLGDFRFCRIRISEAHWFGGFGTAATFQLPD